MKTNIWLTYERMKKQLERRNLPPAEYEKRLAEVCKRLGI